MERLTHIEISKEERIGSYRFHPFPNAPRPKFRSRMNHGRQLKQELDDTTKALGAHRELLGIDGESLLVLEVVSDAISREVLENMLVKFNLFLVEETELNELEKDNRSKLIIQFANKSDIGLFEKERELWEQDIDKDFILTYAQRRDLFNCIEKIRNVSREDRIGPRLKFWLNKLEKEEVVEEFIVNIDIWYNGDRSKIIELESMLSTVLGNQGSKLLGDLFEIPSLLLGRAMVNNYTLNALLDLDIVSVVDLPISTVSTEQSMIYTNEKEPIIIDNLDDNAPLATVLDTGVFTGNKLISSVFVGGEDFDGTENTITDLNGHGTGVAGIVAYGDVNRCINENVFKPLVRICSGKIMHDNNGDPSFSENKRPEQIVKEAILHFYKEYNCRIFNLSAGDRYNIYNGGRQFAWAEMLDQLSRDLDIVIIVSAGNVNNPEIQHSESREDLMKNSRDQLFNPEHRLIDPATSALAITVGSITRFSEPEIVERRGVRISSGEKNYPSVFTRIGKGINGSIKPELVDYGGNYVFNQPTRGDTRWSLDRNILEPTLHNGNDALYKGMCGTSFSAPHVTHIAARIERALEQQIGEKPSANLIRAFLINSAEYTPEMVEWSENSVDVFDNVKQNKKQERKLRLIGYGKASEEILYSGDKKVTLFAEDKLDLRSFHLYKIPVPREFLKTKSNKRIVISMAYNPATKLSRKDYLAYNLWFEVFRRIDEEMLLKFKQRKEKGMDDEEDLSNLPNNNKANFSPGYTGISRSTVQQRIWEKGKRGGSDLDWDDNEQPFIYILVTGKERFKFPEQELPKDYSLVITFRYDGEEDINLYSTLRNSVKIRNRQKEQAQTQIRL